MLSRGNSRSHQSSWIGFCRLSRTRITVTSERPWETHLQRCLATCHEPHSANLSWRDCRPPLIVVVTLLRIFSSTPKLVKPSVTTLTHRPSTRLIFDPCWYCGSGTHRVNAVSSLRCSGMACCMGPILSMVARSSVPSCSYRSWSILVMLLVLGGHVLLEGFVLAKVTGMIAATAIQRFVYSSSSRWLSQENSRVIRPHRFLDW